MSVTTVAISILLILFFAIIGAHRRFHIKTLAERQQMRDDSKALVKKQQLEQLPKVVQKWLLASHIDLQKPISSVQLRQKLKLKLRPKQKQWYTAKATQFVTTNPPAFSWVLQMKMFGILPLQGRDLFRMANGDMHIRLAGLLPMLHAKANDKLNQASLQRYLAEMVWYPTAATSPNIHWESVDDYSAKASMKHLGVEGSGVFTFDKNGRFVAFRANRFKDIHADAKALEWKIVAKSYRQFESIEVPNLLDVSWELESGSWNWLELELTELQYNEGKGGF
ncbi:MAG: hypothetical protein OIF50_09590 [Flavobacteriaceae bacterium]|nr:hypothetical protein [Flavobacteriaceae bacterium]